MTSASASPRRRAIAIASSLIADPPLDGLESRPHLEGEVGEEVGAERAVAGRKGGERLLEEPDAGSADLESRVEKEAAERGHVAERRSREQLAVLPSGGRRRSRARRSAAPRRRPPSATARRRGAAAARRAARRMRRPRGRAAPARAGSGSRHPRSASTADARSPSANQVLERLGPHRRAATRETGDARSPRDADRGPRRTRSRAGDPPRGGARVAARRKIVVQRLPHEVVRERVATRCRGNLGDHAHERPPPRGRPRTGPESAGSRAGADAGRTRVR